jgi:ATP-dependent RNA helicase RhlE
MTTEIEPEDDEIVPMPPGFDTLSLNPALLKAVHELGFTHPTPIQTKAIPIVLGRARPGRLRPDRHRARPPRSCSPSCTASWPARRAARASSSSSPPASSPAQVEEDFRDLGKHSHLKCATVYGGVGFGNQTTALRSGFDIIVATPGRLLDHMERGNARFDKLQVLVLDEADRMMDMGFLPDLRRIIHKLPKSARRCSSARRCRRRSSGSRARS